MMAFSSPYRTTLFLITLLFCRATGQSISSCPSGAYNVTTVKGVQYQACPNTDFQAPSINIINSIATVDACLQLCDGSAGCTKAVYDHIYSICHIKGPTSNIPWVVSTQYDTVRYINNFANGAPINQCPSKVTTINNADGSTAVICPRSDYQSPSVQIINMVADVTTCAGLCTKIPGCIKAVFDHIYLICHIKSSTLGMTWVVNLNQYDSIVIIPAPVSSGKPLSTNLSTTQKPLSTQTPSTVQTSTTQTPTTRTTASQQSTTAQPSASPSTVVTGLTSCPSGATTFTTDDGTLYELCPGTDYQGTSSQGFQNVLSNWDCLQICNETPGCTRSVFDTQNFICYVKGTPLVWTTSAQFDSVRFISKTTTTSPPYQGLGAWSPVIVMPIIPVAAYVVPQTPFSSRVLMFSSYGPDDFSGPTGMTQFADYNFMTGAISARTITNTQHDMFCPGISMIQDGRIVITGGENAEVTSFYNPQTDSFVKGPNMNIPRGYQSSATTSYGQVFTVGGSFSGGIGGKTGEVFDPVANTWTILPGANVTAILTTDAEGPWRTDNHAWLFGWKDGSVFQAGPSKVQHWFGTTGGGSVAVAGTRDPDNDAMCGVNVMYDALNGKIFSTGGSQSYTNSPAFSKAFLTTIGTPFTPSIVQRLPDMNYPRGFANGVVLPDGTVLITGGQKTSLVFTNTDSILIPELFDPTIQTYKQLAPAAIPRNYHSVALLLADGTVFTGGGGMCPTAYGQSDAWCYRAADHPDIEIFSPPYLFKADGTPATRPVISALASSTNSGGLDVNIGGTLTVTMNDASGATFSLIRMGSATHSINTDQRRVPLINVVANGAQYKIQLPGDAGVLIPGYYYLFALSKTGVPSLARTIQVHI